MPRYRLTIEYDGTEFCGWQRQENGVSVQEIMEKAVLNFAKTTVKFIAAGRTDSGVHALGQVVHFDLDAEKPPYTIMHAINHHVKPYKIVVTEAEKTVDTFHARFDCTKREYKYLILNRPAPTAIFNGKVWHIKKPLNTQAMHEAAQLLVGRHDLSSFRSIKCQSKSPVKTIETITVKPIGHDLIEVFISAPSFMHNQVRIITGCLANIGLGRWDQQDLQAVLDAKDRTKAAQTAPAHGLYFLSAKY